MGEEEEEEEEDEDDYLYIVIFLIINQLFVFVAQAHFEIKIDIYHNATEFISSMYHALHEQKSHL